MPYLHLDVNGLHSVEDKKRLAKKMAQTYATMMTVDIRRISIAIREVGDGGVWRDTMGRRGQISHGWLEWMHAGGGVCHGGSSGDASKTRMSQ